MNVWVCGSPCAGARMPGAGGRVSEREEMGTAAQRAGRRVSSRTAGSGEEEGKTWSVKET